eukprot:983699_1
MLCGIIWIVNLFVIIETGWISPSSKLYEINRCQAVGSHDGTIYILAGKDHRDSITQFDINTNSFTNYDENALSPQVGNLYGYAQWYTQQDDMLFMLHGGDFPKSIAMYRMSTNQYYPEWNSLSLSTDVNKFGCLASSPDYLFVVGGTNSNYDSLNTVQAVSFHTFSWLSNVDPMQQKRRCPVCIAHEGKLYAFSGVVDVYGDTVDEAMTKTNERIDINGPCNDGYGYGPCNDVLWCGFDGGISLLLLCVYYIS